ncbi:Hypothetical predicted protein [Mytilus galloprovincialis]|uniref:Uncharacterized protein n=1 Tax=Mytilus galloprovincialis TaxID=29158 RepID=A0A8B6DZL1_MYTGA|nr:Hypothetical predicted protein [Mytilus galloprovincialis]
MIQDMYWFLSVLLVITSANAKIRCLEGVRLTSPLDTTIVTECGDHEICSVERYVTNDGIILYNVGCKDRQYCIANPLGIGKRAETVICRHCCEDKDLCNMNQCGARVNLPVGSTICYKCPLAMDANKCNHITLCDRDSSCSIKQTQNLIGKPRWSHGCSEKTQCATIAQNNPQGICSFCCDTELCNRNCTIRSTIAPPPTTTTTTTTTMAPTTPIPMTAPIITQTISWLRVEAWALVTEHSEPMCFGKIGRDRMTLAIICLDCRRIPQPYDCTTVTECSTNEVCYIEKYETSNGQTTWHLYNVGCKPLNSCTSSGPRLPVVGKRSARKSIDTTTCHECCSDKDICNLEGHCGSANFTKPDSTCSIKQTQNLLGEPRWMHGCSQKSQCSTIAHINPQGICSFCCDTELCNRKCTIKSTVATPPSTSTTATTTMAPTTPIPRKYHHINNCSSYNPTTTTMEPTTPIPCKYHQNQQ